MLFFLHSYSISIFLPSFIPHFSPLFFSHFAIFIDLSLYPSFSISLSEFLCLPSIFTSCNFTVSVHLLQQRIPRYCSKMWINYTLLTASFKYWEHVQRTVRAFQVKAGSSLISPLFFFLILFRTLKFVILAV